MAETTKDATVTRAGVKRPAMSARESKAYDRYREATRAMCLAYWAKLDNDELRPVVEAFEKSVWAYRRTIRAEARVPR